MAVNSAHLVGKLKDNFLLVEFKSNVNIENLVKNHEYFSLNLKNSIPRTVSILNYTTKIEKNELNLENKLDELVINSTYNFKLANSTFL